MEREYHLAHTKIKRTLSTLSRSAFVTRLSAAPQGTLLAWASDALLLDEGSYKHYGVVYSLLLFNHESPSHQPLTNRILFTTGLCLLTCDDDDGHGVFHSLRLDSRVSMQTITQMTESEVASIRVHASKPNGIHFVDAKSHC